MKFSYVPAYGFGKANRNELYKSDEYIITPGPWNYKPNKLTNQLPQWKIGTSERPKEPNLDVPGPGAYNIEFNNPKGPSYSIASKPKKKAEEMETPGPAAYDPLNLNKKSSYTFGHKYKDKQNEMSPGPGRYNIRTDKDLLAPSNVFGQEKKLTSGNENKNPGPGKYNNNKIEYTNIQHPIYSFGRKKRVTDNINDYPGPGSYKHKEYVGKEGKKISMGIKLRSRSMEYIPGPGQYESKNSDALFKKLPDIKIGKASRFSNSNIFSENPGPGQYNDADLVKNVKLNKPSWKIGTSKRKPLNEYVDSPGPGAYNIRKGVGDGSPQYSMRIKNKDSESRFVTPGPGRYNNDELNNYKHFPSWKIGTSKRDDSLKRQIREGFPGPGSYKSNDKHLASPPRYGFGSAKRYKDKYNDNPGPGSYHIPCSIVEVNNYTREQGVFDENFKFI